jgi:eukaryotic-like serine/threonine-protein kinase
MTADEWRKVRDVFDAAVGRSGAERRAFVDAACGGEGTLHAEVLSLLAAHDASPAFIEQPVFEAAPELFIDADPVSLEDRTIGPYIVRHEIGRGGMGVVYLADDTRLSRRVALKAVTSHFGGGATSRERLRQEARAAATLSHPNIATIYALEDIDGALFLVSEYVPGPTLRTLLEAGSVTTAQVVDMALQLGRALAAAHAQGIVHRDLKPENIVRTAAGTIKVLDFGIAKADIFTPAAAASADDRLGTPAYMAPEQIRGGPVDFRADLFSFGVLVYEMVSGANPFEAGSRTATMARVLEHEPPVLDTDRDHAALSRIVATCLRKEPASRDLSTTGLVRDLEQLLKLSDARRDIGEDAATPGRDPRFWWDFHQRVISMVYILTMYPVWQVRSWLSTPWGTWFVLSALVCAVTASTLRLHLSFTSRIHPAELRTERRRTQLWTRICDVAMAAVLLTTTLRVGVAHQAIAMLFVTLAVVLMLASFIIEPATARASFGS